MRNWRGGGCAELPYHFALARWTGFSHIDGPSWIETHQNEGVVSRAPQKGRNESQKLRLGRKRRDYDCDTA